MVSPPKGWYQEFVKDIEAENEKAVIFGPMPYTVETCQAEIYKLRNRIWNLEARLSNMKLRVKEAIKD